MGKSVKYSHSWEISTYFKFASLICIEEMYDNDLNFLWNIFKVVLLYISDLGTMWIFKISECLFYLWAYNCVNRIFFVGKKFLRF